MAGKEESQPRVDDLVAQLAAKDIQLETAANQITELRQRCDQAEAKLTASQSEVEGLRKQRQDDAAESPAKLKEQIKALVAKNVELEKQRQDAASPERIKELVHQRVQLQAKAQLVLGEEVRVDELDDRTLMVTTIDKIMGPGKDKNEKGEPRSDEYVKALFESGVDSHLAGSAAIARVRAATENLKEQTQQRADSRTQRQKFLDSMAGIGTASLKEESR